MAKTISRYERCVGRVPVTLKELATQCGMSVSTVSKALNGYPDIREETRDLIRQAAAKAGYQPNSMARGLKTGRTFNIGVLYSDEVHFGFMHSYFSPVLQSFKMETEARGYDLTFISHRVGENPTTYLEQCHYRNVDGVCVVCAEFEDPEVMRLMAGPIPAVSIDYVFNNRTCVQSQNREGMTMLVRYVLSRGHTRVAIVEGGPEENVVTNIRRTCFLKTMQEAGLEVPEAYIVPGSFHDPDAARQATEKLLELPERPTCILMSDDYAALGGLEAVRSAGLRVPEDISVAGFDGVEWIQRIRPKLTTVRQDTQTIGREAARRLIAQVEAPRTTLPEIVRIPCSLWQGETVMDITRRD